MNDLFQTIVGSQNGIFISYLPSQSKHKKSAQAILNDMMISYPEWANAIRYLSILPVQCWAAQERSNLQFNWYRLQEFLDYEDSSDPNIFGLRSRATVETYSEIIKDTNEIIAIIRNYLYKKPNGFDQKNQLNVLRAIHTCCKKETTRYLINTYYERAVGNYCEQCHDALDQYDRKLADILNDLDIDIQFAYHNTSIMIMMMPKWKNEDFYRSASVDLQGTIHYLEKCIHCLEKYPFNSDIVYVCVDRVSKGENVNSIARSIGKSRTYVEARYEEGINALSCLIWGYSIRDYII